MAILNHTHHVAAPLSYVTTQSIETPKELPQEGVRSWEREWINPELKTLLFGPNQPVSPDTAPKMRTYLIVDANLYLEYRGLFDLDMLDDHPVMCMFSGDAAERMKFSAPYLIDMTMDSAAYNDDYQVSSFMRRYFDLMWGKNVGTFIHSPAPLKTVHQHFKKFLRFEIENANNRFFRFWDPRVSKVHCPTLASYYKASSKFFLLPNDQYPPVSFIYEEHVDPQLDISNADQPIKDQADNPTHMPITTTQASFDQSSFAQMQQRLREYGPSANPVADIPLMEIVDKSFTLHKTQTFCKETAAWLVKHYGKKQFKELEVWQFLYQQIKPLNDNYFLTLEYETKYALAGCYLMEKDIDQIPTALLIHLNQFNLTPAQRAEIFLENVQKITTSDFPFKNNDIKKDLP
jgi:hypothetical protein